MRSVHRRMMLETTAADEAHQSLQIRHFDDGAIAESLDRIVRELAFADVGGDAAVAIVGGDATERDRPAGCAAGKRAPGVLLTERGAEDRRRADLDVRQKRLRPVPAVEEHALVRVVAVVVVPVDERTRFA